MPLTEKGEKIMRSMREEYGPKKGESVFYASANKGNITGVHDAADDRRSACHRALDCVLDWHESRTRDGLMGEAVGAVKRAAPKATELLTTEPSSIGDRE